VISQTSPGHLATDKSAVIVLWTCAVVALLIHLLTNITLAEFIILHGKHYYLAAIYPMLFGAGGVAIERLFATRMRFLRPLFAAAMLCFAALLAPTVIPILPPQKLLGYMQAIHFQPPRTETSHTALLPQLFADQFGSEEMTRSVARAFNRLSPNDQMRVAIFCQNYARRARLIFLAENMDSLPHFPNTKIIFFGDRAGTMAS